MYGVLFIREFLKLEYYGEKKGNISPGLEYRDVSSLLWFVLYHQIHSNNFHSFLLQFWCLFPKTSIQVFLNVYISDFELEKCLY